MPRQGNGDYVLPEDPVITGEIIEAVWANNSFDDFRTTFQDSLSRSGNGGMLQPLKLADGTSKSVPGLSFGSESNTGFRRAGPGDLYLSILGVDHMRWTDDNGVQISVDDGTTWSDVATALVYEEYVNEREVTDVTWTPASNTLTLVKTIGNETVEINAFDDGLSVGGTGLDVTEGGAGITGGVDITGALDVSGGVVTAFDGLEVGAQVNQISAIATGSVNSKTIDTTVANRWIMDNDTGGGTLTLNFVRPAGVRDIGPDYTVEGNVIVTNGPSPGAVQIRADNVNVAPDDVLSSVAPLAGSKSLLSYIMHNRSGTYTMLFIWSSVG